MDMVFDTPELITDLSEYSWSRQSEEAGGPPGRAAQSIHDNSPTERQASIRFLQIFAAADYYTTNKTQMRYVEPVYVDLILDPYVFNLIPRSLIPTVGYILLVAVASWFLARRISLWVRDLATFSDQEKKAQ